MIVFSPGPANLTERVLRSLAAPAVSHRGPEVQHLLQTVRRDLLAVAGVAAPDWQAVLLGGSGTVAIESCLAALRGRRVLVIANGPYGERAGDIAHYHGVLVQPLTFGWGEIVPETEIERAIVDGRPEYLYMVHHETATGRLNDLQSAARIASAHDVRVIADTISSFAGEVLPLEEWGIEAALGSSTKCLRAVPGVAFVIARRRFLEMAAGLDGVHYSHLGMHFRAGEHGSTPFTPPVHSLFALAAALDELLDEGVPARQAHYRDVSSRLRTGLRTLGIEFLLEDGPLASTMVACLRPAGISFPALYDALADRGFAIYGAQGPFEPTSFRLGLVGAFGVPEVESFLIALADVLPGLRQ